MLLLFLVLSHLNFLESGVPNLTFDKNMAFYSKRHKQNHIDKLKEMLYTIHRGGIYE